MYEALLRIAHQPGLSSPWRTFRPVKWAPEALNSRNTSFDSYEELERVSFRSDKAGRQETAKVQQTKMSTNRAYWLLLLVPVTICIRLLFPARQTVIFAFSCASMVPLARLLSDATEQIAARVGPTAGALLNVTFGNAGELVIGFFAMREGLQEVVKASITGSILVNLLLTLGVSMVAGGIRHKTLKFNVLAARTRSTTMCLAGIALIFPAAFDFIAGPGHGGSESRLSLEFAIILSITYGLGLLFTLHTHRELLAADRSELIEDKAAWSIGVAIGVLIVSASLVGLFGDILATSLEPTARAFGLSDLFVGLVIVAVASNAAESTAAVRAALRNRMNLSVGIAIGSSTQIALFVAPALVIASQWIGSRPVNLVFSSVELMAMILAIIITIQVAGDGESNWLEGVQLVVVYLLIAVTVFFLPSKPGGAHP
jgi:Ca2+:H+ antiporter